MITLSEWKLIGITLIATFFISAIVYGVMLEIVARIKNKAQKITRKQIIRKAPKFNLCDYLIANMKQDYIGYSKVIRNELARM